MSVILLYLIGAITYVISTLCSYSEKFKLSAWYFPFGIAIAIVANLAWLYVAKLTPGKDDLFVRALVWDSMIMSAFTLTPILALGVRPTAYTVAGTVLIIFGIVMLKLDVSA